MNFRCNIYELIVYVLCTNVNYIVGPDTADEKEERML